MKYWKERIVCLFRGHWISTVGLYVPNGDGSYREVPGCLRCRKKL